MHRIYLKACSDDGKINRDWEAIVSPSLFGNIIVECHWGRVGCKGRTLTKSFDTHSEALRYYHSLIKRRMTLKKRVGVSYRIVSQTT